MKTRFGFIFCLIMLAMTGCAGFATAAPAGTPAGQTDSTTPYNGQIGPGNSLYGLKIAFENIDESFTFNQSERLEKQINHANMRLTELKQALIDNKTDTAAIALEQYWMKINQTDEALEPLSINGTEHMPAINDTGLLHAREMIMKHQNVLEDLLQSHPNNTGIERAYGNSIELEQKFEKRIENARMIQQQTNQKRSFISPKNQTGEGSGPGTGYEGNMTVPREWNQSRDMNKFTGNSTMNGEQNIHGMNQSVQDPRQLPNNTMRNTGNTQNGNDSDNQNTNNNANQENRNNNVMDPAKWGNTQNTNIDRDTGSMNNRSNNGNNNGNTKNSGR